jgi:rhamnosyltransferase
MLNLEEGREKFCVVVVTYFPDKPCLRNLEKLSARCDRLFIVDNTASYDDSFFSRLKNVSLIKVVKNIGLAAALNKGINLAGQSGFENIFLFDQDSRQPDDFFQKMLAFKADADVLRSDFAFYVPDFFDRNSETYATFPTVKRFTMKHRKCRDLTPIGLDAAVIAVTSGTLMNYSVYKKLGPFREDYFIDFIDNEYCLRAYKLGYKVAVNCGVVLDHSIGKRSKRRFWGVTLKPNFHSPLRRYYIARNGVRTALEFGCSRPVYLALIFARLCHEVLSILFAEDEKARKIMAMTYGLLHGFTARMGPCALGSLLDEEKSPRRVWVR